MSKEALRLYRGDDIRDSLYYPLPGDQILVETEAKGLWGKLKVWMLGSRGVWPVFGSGSCPQAIKPPSVQ